MSSALEEDIQLCKDGKFAEAIEKLKGHLRFEPTNIRAHNSLAIAYGQTGQYKEAVNEFLALTHLEPGNAAHCYNLGQAYEADGNALQAIGAYQKALQLKPDYQKANDSLSALTAKQLRGDATQVAAVPAHYQSNQQAPQVAIAPIARRAVPLVVVVAISTVILLAITGLLINKHSKAIAAQEAERQRVQIAQDAIESLCAIGSALKVGINEQAYGEKLIAAQTKIDAYKSKHGDDALSSILEYVQGIYKDADSIWIYSMGDSNHVYDSSYHYFIRPNEPLYTMCKDNLRWTPLSRQFCS